MTTRPAHGPRPKNVREELNGFSHMLVEVPQIALYGRHDVEGVILASAKAVGSGTNDLR